MKLLHTADWQIGMDASHTGAAAARVRQARLETAARIAEIARAESVDLAVLAGDTFEDHAIAVDDVERTAAILGAFPCPVYVLPGNHDPLVAGSVWERPAWSRYPNVRLLTSAEPVEAPHCVLFPCPLRSRWAAGDPTAWIPSAAYADRIRVGIAHGSLAGLPTGGRTHPIPADAAWVRRLDYLALGDWHSQRIYGGPGPGLRMAYSGTPEPTRFGEDTSGAVLIVEIQAPQAKPVLRPVATARLSWRQLAREIGRGGDLARVRAEAEQLAGGDVLLDIRLSGALPPEDAGELDRIRGLAGRFLFLRVTDEDLRPILRLDDLAEGPLKEAARRLDGLCGTGQAEAARLALRTLLRLAHGAGR